MARVAGLKHPASIDGPIIATARKPAGITRLPQGKRNGTSFCEMSDCDDFERLPKSGVHHVRHKGSGADPSPDNRSNGVWRLVGAYSDPAREHIRRYARPLGTWFAGACSAAQDDGHRFARAELGAIYTRGARPRPRLVGSARP